MSIRRACAVLELDTSTYHYKSRRPDQASLKTRIKEIAQTRVRYGYRRVQVMLDREGWRCLGEVPLASGHRADVMALDETGRVLIAEIKTTLADFRAKVQAVFQDPWSSLNPRMTVGRTIAEALIVQGADKAVIAARVAERGLVPIAEQAEEEKEGV